MAQDRPERFPLLGERATFNMYPHYGMLDLMDAKERHEKDCTFFMKVEDEKKCRICGWCISLPTRR